MKKVTIYLFLVIGIFFISQRLIAQDFNSLSIGEKHNTVCENYLNLYNSSNTTHTPNLVLERTKELIDDLTEISNIFTSKSSLKEMLNMIYPTCNLNDSKKLVAIVIEETKKLIPANIDISVVDSFGIMVENNYINVSELEILVENMEKNYYENELLTGMLSILKNSNEFWLNNTNWSDDDIQGMVQADCAGYLLGWGKAIYDEVKEHGELDEDNSWSRVGEGLWGAAAFSTGVSKWFKF